MLRSKWTKCKPYKRVDNLQDIHMAVSKKVGVELRRRKNWFGELDGMPDRHMGPHGPVGPIGPIGPHGPIRPHGAPWGPMGPSGMQSGPQKHFVRLRSYCYWVAKTFSDTAISAWVYATCSAARSPSIVSMKVGGRPKVCLNSWQTHVHSYIIARLVFFKY